MLFFLETFLTCSYLQASKSAISSYYTFRVEKCVMSNAVPVHSNSSIHFQDPSKKTLHQTETRVGSKTRQLKLLDA